MKATGIVRRIDDLGRVVIPKEIRRTLRIREGDPLEIFTDREGGVILKKYSPIGELTDFSKEYAESLQQAIGHIILISDKDAFVSVSGASKKDYIERKGIELTIDPEMEEKIIKCDEHEIERCIVNLVSNAAKFTPEGGTIEVTIEDLDEKVKIIVKDTGIGIDKKYHDSIFNRFNQVIDQGAESKGGSGLGLTITKQIIDMHGGQISVESELGKGCKFIIIL